MIFGASLFAAALLPPTLRDPAARRVRRIARRAAALVAGAALLRLPLQASAMAGSWSAAWDVATLEDVLTGTAAGHAWVVQVSLAALLVVAARSGWLQGLAWTSGLVLAAVALSGHAPAEPGLVGWLASLGLVLHLLAAGAWIGSLPEVTRFMAALRHEDPGSEARETAQALRRFSAVGHGVVALLIGTGAADTLLIAGLSRALPASAYGAVLLAKLCLAAGMAILALVNRYRLVPRWATDPAARRATLTNTRGVLWLGCAAVAASGLLGLLDPP